MPLIYGSGASALSWTDARTKVRGDLWRPGSAGVPDDVVDRALHDALREIEGARRWLWLERVNGAITLTEASNTIDLPTSARTVNSLAYLSGRTGYDPLTRSSIVAVRSLAQGGVTGYPGRYAFEPGRIFLDCIAPAGGKFELIFKARCPETVGEAIANPPPTLSLQETAAIALACANAALTYLRDEATAGRFRARYEQQLRVMEDEEDEARSSESGGSIEGDTLYHELSNRRWP